jgi:(R,R)-butanediol dehydrogenase/meso-butanediol dehydrogenase/diacetyl reductase
MKAITFEGKDSVAVVDIPVPQTKDDWVLIQVAFAGICGTDLSIASGKHPRARPPLVMGHEFVGQVAELPKQPRSDLHVGDWVTVFPLLSCGECYICQMGMPHVCKHLGLLGIDTDGAFAEYVLVPQQSVLKIPSGLAAAQGALIEPISVCVHSARMSRLQIGDSVVVTGAGPIGLLMAMVARAAGARKVVITEVAPARISGARDMGFTVLNAAREDLVESVLEETDGRGGDIVFEATGHPSVASYLMDLVRIRGQIVQVGIFKEPVPLDMRTLNFHEVDVIGARVYTKEDFRMTISLAADGKFDLGPLVSDVLPIVAGVEGFGSAKNATSLKILFEVRP